MSEELKYQRVLRAVAETPWAILPAKLAVIQQLLAFRAAGGRLTAEEIREQIGKALDELSDNHRAVLVMRELEGLTYEEMAEVMQCSKGTIMSRLFHARKNMQKRLLDYMGGKKDLDA